MNSLSGIWLSGLFKRRRLSMLATVAGVAITVALLASIFGFLAAAEKTMTSQAIAGVAVDWQVQLGSGVDPAAAAQELQRAPGYARLVPVGFFTSPGFQSATADSTQSTGAGIVLGLGDGYAAAFPAEIRNLVGGGGVMLAQQTAANLHAAPGSTVLIQRPGLDPVSVTVDSVVDLPLADSLFQSIGAPVGATPQAPPDNILILPLAQWHTLFDPVAAVAPGVLSTQLHVALLHQLPSAPAAAYTQVVGQAKNYETRLAGGGVVGNNLATKLDSARADAAFARVLFLFLGLPGAAVAALLTLVIVAASGERRRRERALLKLRGASAAWLLRLATYEAITVGIAGGAVGLGVAAVMVRTSFGAWTFGSGRTASITWAFVACAAGLGLVLAAFLIPTVRSTRSESVARGRSLGRAAGGPIWERAGLDFVLLGVAALVYWRSGQNGYQLILATEGAPRIAVSYVPFLAPLCLWSGLALLTMRLVRLLLVRGQRVTRRLITPFTGPLAGLVSAGLGRQARSLLPGVALAMLAVAFAISTATFNSTYAAQSRVDAELTNGADVTVSGGASANLAGHAAAIAVLPDVKAVAQVQHRFAYVGADLQDLYGIDPASITSASKLSDAFFAGGTAAELMAKLAATPDGLLVAKETVTDFQLAPGDVVKLRLQSAVDHQYHVVPFHYIGVALEFPTAPKDSFLIANASYMAAQTASNSVETLLIKTGSSTASVAASIQTLLGPSSGASVRDIQSVERSIKSGLTAVSLRGLTRIELAFAVVLAAAGAGLTLSVGLERRRRTLAIASALGATSRQVRGFVWSEATFVLLGGIVGGGALGFIAARMLVKILTQAFDPPPTGMTIPWTYLLVVGASICASIVVAGRISARQGERSVLETIRRF